MDDYNYHSTRGLVFHNCFRGINQKQLAEGINNLKGPMSPKEEDMVVKSLISLCTDVKYEMAA